MVKSLKKAFLFLGIVTTVLFSGCYKARLVAPHGKTIYLAKRGEFGEERTKRVWYLLGGLIPLSETNPTDIIGDCKRVRATFYISFIDGLIQTLTLGILTPATFKVICVDTE